MCAVGQVMAKSIDTLSDDVLLEIFYFCSIEDVYIKREIEAWQSLVHVCKRWRTVVFESPRRLNLRLYCATERQKRVRDMLDIWPALLLIIEGRTDRPEELDNTTAVLERSNRVCHINLRDVSASLLEDVLAAMQKPFPELTFLSLQPSKEIQTAVIPDSFLGGSAPRLQVLWLASIPFPGIPKLLSSATHLQRLYLTDIPYPEYFTLKAMVTVLSTLTSLRSLNLEFHSPRSVPRRRPPPIMTRTVLPDLKVLTFKGVSEYLEHIVAHIDAPQLSYFDITFFNQVVFDTPQTNQFVEGILSLKAFNVATLSLGSDTACCRLSSKTRERINVNIACREFDWQISSLEQVCNSSFPPLPALEELYIYEGPFSMPEWKDNIENALWLELLQPFSAVKILYISRNFALRIAPALQEVVGTTAAEVLPALQIIFLEGLGESGPDQEGIVEFVTSRQLSGHPIAVSLWVRPNLD